MEQNVVGVNEQVIDKLILDIYDYADRANIILNSIEDIIDNVPSYYVDSCSNNFRYNYEQLRQNFPIVVNNIKSYASDLVKVKNSFINNNDAASQLVRKKTTEVEEEIELL